MATAIHSGATRRRNPSTSAPLGTLVPLSARRPSPSGADLLGTHPGIVASPFVTPDEQIAITAMLDASGGTCALGDLAHALPGVARPVSAVLCLVDAGVLGIDRTSPFDAHTEVWRS